MKQKNLKLYLFVLTFVFAAGCADSSSGSGVSLPITGSLAPNNWRTSCLSATSGSLDSVLNFAGGSYTNTLNLYSGSGCATASGKFTETGTYAHGSMNSSGTANVDWTLQSMQYTPLSVAEVNGLNTATECGYSDWALGVAKDLAGRTCGSITFPSAGAVQYDIYNIAQFDLPFTGEVAGELKFGSSSGGMDGTTPAKRPTALDGSMVYTVF